MFIEDVPDNWNLCDTWPLDIYGVEDYGDGIEITQVVADYQHTDEIEYVVDYDNEGNALIYWYKIDND